MEGSASGTTTLHQPWIPKWGWRGPTNHHPSPLRTHIALEIMTPGITAFSAGMGPAPALLVSPGAGVRGTYVLRLPSLPQHHHQRLGSGNLPTAWTQDRAWRPWAGRTHKVTLPGDAAGPGGAARDGGVGGMKMGSRMTPCCPERGSAWVRAGTVLDCLHGSWHFPQAGKGVCGPSVTRTMPTTVRGSAPEQVPRRSFHQHSPRVPPTSFTDPVRRHSEVKLQAQVKSNPGSCGKRHPEPSVSATGSEQEAQACLWGGALCLSAGTGPEACPASAALPDSSWKESGASPGGGHPPGSAAPVGTRRPGEHPQTSQWQFYLVPGPTPGRACGPGHTPDLVPLPRSGRAGRG